jgi:hypothetical protein
MGFISVSVGPLHFLLKLHFWLRQLYYDSLPRLQMESTHHVGGICRRLLESRFLAVAATSGPIPIVDCKTENWVWLCKCANLASANTFLFSASSSLKFRHSLFSQIVDESDLKLVLN